VIIDSNVTHRKGSFLCLGLGLSPKLSSDPSSIMLPEPPLAGANVPSIGNCFIKSNVDFTTASGWLQRLVRPRLMLIHY